MSLMILLAVGVGGGIGALIRYFVAGAIQSAAWPGYPWGIFVVNITGGFVMGLIVELSALKISLTPEMRAFLTTGILGGYTTFSTFSLDAALLIERHSLGMAAGYMVGSVAAGLSALFFGLALFRSGAHLP